MYALAAWSLILLPYTYAYGPVCLPSCDNVGRLVRLAPIVKCIRASSTSIPAGGFRGQNVELRLRNVPGISLLHKIAKSSHLALVSLFLALSFSFPSRVSAVSSASAVKAPVMSSPKGKNAFSRNFAKAADCILHDIVEAEHVLEEKAKGIMNDLAKAEKALETNIIKAEKALEKTIIDAEHEIEEEAKSSWKSLIRSLEGSRMDTLILLITTCTIIPLCKKLQTSPILGFLMTGTLLGPNGLSAITDIHMMHTLGELGIVMFLFEMGLELSIDRLKKMKKDVFGLGTSQFLLTATAATGLGKSCGLSLPGAITVGGSLALSSSAFVLQLLKDNGSMDTRYGEASFGILLLQDLMVVPLIVIVELLGKGGGGMQKALLFACAKALFALGLLTVVGKAVLNRIFNAIDKTKSQEAFMALTLATLLAMSFFTQGIGLSDTLGAFVAGLLLAETKHQHKIEGDVAPFRGLLLGFFFITVGFSIDPRLILTQAPKILLLLTTLIVGKAAIITGLSTLFGISFKNAQYAGLLNSQAGEFSFVALGIAEASGLISTEATKLLLTTVALSMALTPVLGDLGAHLASRIDDNVLDPPTR